MAPPSVSGAEIRKSFKMHGFSLRPDAAAHIQAVFKDLDEFQTDEWVGKLVEALQKRELATASVNKELAVAVLKVIFKNKYANVTSNNLNGFNLVPVFQVQVPHPHVLPKPSPPISFFALISLVCPQF